MSIVENETEGLYLALNRLSDYTETLFLYVLDQVGTNANQPNMGTELSVPTGYQTSL